MSANDHERLAATAPDIAADETAASERTAMVLETSGVQVAPPQEAALQEATKSLALDIGLLAAGMVAAVSAAWGAGFVVWYVALALIGTVAGLALILSRRAYRRLQRVAMQPIEQAQTALAAETAGVLKRLPDAVLVLDAAGRVIFVNSAARGLTDGAAAAGKHISALIRAPQLIDAVKRATETEEPQQAEYAILVPVERAYHAHVVPVPAMPGKPTIFAVVLHDQTPMKRIERMRADFVANASHELRTPLASLTGFIDTLRGHAKDDAVAREKFLEIMADQTARMRRLIDDLLSLSRIELNEHNPPSAQADLEAVVREVVDLMQPLAREANMRFDIRLREPVPPVTGDRDELVQVIQNLVDNAVKYGAPGQTVTIELGVGSEQGGRLGASGMAYVTVRDEGDGIPREAIPRLTERFYRVDVQRSRTRGGTGLGLAIVKHIVNRHRGRLDIESAPGEGAAFTVRIPCAASRPVQPDRRPEAA